MTDGQNLLNIIPLVVGAGVTIGVLHYLFPENKIADHDSYQKSMREKAEALKKVV